MGQVNWYRHFNATKNEDAQTRYDAQAYRCFGVLEGQIQKGGSFILGGDRPSAVDLHFFGWLRLTTFAGLDMTPYPGIVKWKKVVEELPAVKRAYERIASGTEQ